MDTAMGKKRKRDKKNRNLNQKKRKVTRYTRSAQSYITSLILVIFQAFEEEEPEPAWCVLTYTRRCTGVYSCNNFRTPY